MYVYICTYVLYFNCFKDILISHKLTYVAFHLGIRPSPSFSYNHSIFLRIQPCLELCDCYKFIARSVGLSQHVLFFVPLIFFTFIYFCWDKHTLTCNIWLQSLFGSFLWHVFCEYRNMDTLYRRHSWVTCWPTL